MTKPKQIILYTSTTTNMATQQLTKGKAVGEIQQLISKG